MRDTDTGIYMENETLGNFARNTASAMEAQGSVPGRRTAGYVAAVLRRLKARLVPGVARGEPSRAREWFCDNWYLVQREGRWAQRALSDLGRLPGTAGSRRAAVVEAAGALVRAGRGQVTADRIRLFLDEFQKSRVLTERELTAFIPALKAELAAFLDEVYPRELRDLGEDRELAELAENVFTSLRLLADVDLSRVLEGVNRVEAALRADPSGIYPLMDEDTRALYRTQVARVAKKAGIPQHEAAKKAVELAGSGGENHVGHYIFTRPLGEERRRSQGGWYIALNVVASLFFALLAGIAAGSWAVFLLTVLPVTEIVKNAVDFVLLRVTRPTRLPRMELAGGIPGRARTLCVISALLTRESDGPKYARLMEEYRLLNRDAGENLLFGILADLPESPERLHRDDGRILDAARAAVEALNEKYGGGFWLLVRDRELNTADGIWMGRERKRGAIEELTKLLSGEKSALRAEAGDGAALRGCAFILTLDADTRLTAGAARELVGAALHPLNVPVIHEKTGRVVSGYGILQPRVAVDLSAAGKSDFSRIFAGEGGVDPYSGAVSDLYQDLFAQGTFMGKGLINVPVYRRVLEGTFPDNAVLSHDILEGAYLGCAYVSDTELTDGWPGRVTAYFARQERWTRGDWQNIRWCTRYVRNASGALVKNPLTPLSRWKVFDNLRRSLVPAAALAALLIPLSAGRLLTVLTALAALLTPLLLSFGELFLRHDGTWRVRFQSPVLSGPAGAILQAAVRLLLLPAEGWIQLRAAVTAVVRMTVTKRRLLAWVTSSQAERRHGNTILVNYRALAACPIAGAAALFLTASPLMGAAGVLWLAAPAYAWAVSRDNRRARTVSAGDRGYLLRCAGEIWRYFQENLTQEDNYLPPDNVQTDPDLGRAHRTSPTNIGLAMLSCAAAADLGLIPESQASELVRHTLDTVEKLTRWNGNLLNWYDTRTLTPLEPGYVSAVDSGNLLGCLIALRQWFLELGDGDSAARCGKLCDGTDLRPLYDPQRRLFHIGYDLSRGALSQGWYDLLASEARAMSYIAVALGQAPRRHWRRLGRVRVSLDRYSGMASWTGTMFEYLMPNLLLPCPDNSLLAESSRFCLYAQKRAHAGIPWGISESAYYAFDPGLSYRYKAHGVQRLALKRGMESQRVVSPYSSFLALPLDTAGAVKNLKRLEAAGLRGRYGFFEAADYTDGTCRPVRTFMAHHLGMSLVAVANTLLNDIFPRRFMADVRMAAYRELLEERLPTGKLILRQPPREVPATPRRAESAGYREELCETDALEPRGVPLSNGVYTALCSETGHVRSLWRGLDITRWEPDPQGRTGMALYLRQGDRILPLTPAPDYKKDVAYRCELTDSYCRFRAREGQMSAALTVFVPPSGAGEVRRVEIACPQDGGEAELLCLFEPVLQRREDYLSHPAFSRLALEASVSANVLTLRRRPRPGEGDVYLAVTADAPMTVTNHRRRGDRPDAGELLRASPDMRVCVRIPVALTGGRGRVTLALAPSDTAGDASAAAKSCLRARDSQAVSRISAAALMLGMKPSQVRGALTLMPALTFGPVMTPPRRENLSLSHISRESLWEYGVSGTLPVAAAVIESEEQIPAAADLVRQHEFLRENGVEFDLVLLITDGGDYRSAQREAVTDALRNAGREGRLGETGGVWIGEANPRSRQVFGALSAAFVRLDAVQAEPAHRARTPGERRPYIRGSVEPQFDLGPDGTLRVLLRGVLPGAGWSQILANRTFGALMTETGAGYLWKDNSRLMKLTPAPTDPGDPEPGESLTITLPGGERRSLFADGTDIPTAVEAGFGFIRWERELPGIRSRLTAFVPEKLDLRLLILELRGSLDGAGVDYRVRPAMGESNTPDPAVFFRREGESFVTRAVSGPFRGTAFRILASAPVTAFTCDGDEPPEGELSGAQGPAARPCAALRFQAGERLVIAAGCMEEAELRRALESAETLLAETRRRWADFVSAAGVHTGDRQIDAYAGGWAAYQTYACRILARTGLYQNGGAVGFRDQLQDALALAGADPAITAEQLKLAAARQYTQGDVMHWWHDTPQGPMGVRTRCSDDLLWLPYALCGYVERTGDRAVCRERAAYLISPPLADTERDRYERPETTAETDTILAHAVRAARLFLERGTGAHGLALILSGDWNDGFDGLGREGRGESTWLTFFGSLTLRRLAALCEKEGDSQDARAFLRAADDLLRAGEGTWTGHWYLRAYDDQGRPIGVPGCGECELDSLPQSFALFAGADKARCREALLQAYERLFQPETRTVKLFDPPFDSGPTNPGYIKTYAPGFRENGGQYTHAAVWLAMALNRAGERERAMKLLSALSPWGREERRYVTEPHILCADVYTAPGHQGRGGWSWYTGSAGWYLRAAQEMELACKAAGG